MALADLPHGVPGGHHLNPKQRKTLLVVGAAGVLVLMLVLARRRAAVAPSTTPADASTPDPFTGAPGAPSTFADNGGQAAQLGTAVTSSLGDVATSLSGVQQSLDDLATRPPADAAVPGPLVTINNTPGSPSGSDVTKAAVAAAVAAVARSRGPAPRPAARAKAAPKPKTKAKAAAKAKPAAHHAAVHAPIHQPPHKPPTKKHR